MTGIETGKIERRPARVAERALRREHIELGGVKVFYSVVPVDSDIPKGDIGIAYPYPEDRDLTGPELIVRECLEGAGVIMQETVESYVRKYPGEFSIDRSKLQ